MQLGAASRHFVGGYIGNWLVPTVSFTNSSDFILAVMCIPQCCVLV